MLSIIVNIYIYIAVRISVQIIGYILSRTTVKSKPKNVEVLKVN